jgi:hypothetical protein
MRTNELMTEFRQKQLEISSIQAKDPLDPEYKRLNYIRYADDFLVGMIGSKEEAKEVFQTIKLACVHRVFPSLRAVTFSLTSTSGRTENLGHLESTTTVKGRTDDGLHPS